MPNLGRRACRRARARPASNSEVATHRGERHRQRHATCSTFGKVCFGLIPPLWRRHLPPLAPAAVDEATAARTLHDCASRGNAAVLRLLEISADGLTNHDAALRDEQPEQCRRGRAPGHRALLLALANPLSLLPVLHALVWRRVWREDGRFPIARTLGARAAGPRRSRRLRPGRSCATTPVRHWWDRPLRRLRGALGVVITRRNLRPVAAHEWMGTASVRVD